MSGRPTSGVPTRVLLLIISFIPLFLGIGFLQIVLGAWLVTVGFTAVQAGTLIAAQGITVLVTSIQFGIISDVYGRKYLLMMGALAGAASLFAFSLTTDFWLLLVISLVLGFTEGASITTWNALLADLTEGPSRNKVFSLSFIMINVATGVGLVLPGIFPPLEGVLGISNYSLHRETMLLLGVASFATPIMFYLLLRRHEETHNPGRKWGGLSNKGTLVKIGFVGSTIGFGAGFIIPLVGPGSTIGSASGMITADRYLPFRTS